MGGLIMVTGRNPLAMIQATQSTLALACITRLAFDEDLTVDEKAKWIDELPMPLALSENDRKVAETMLHRMTSSWALCGRLLIVVRTR
jgi:hypothetical protein